ncbi:MAG TPA: hypothetical protein VGM11_16035 [Acidobacteriaceae bacterium]|jgi:hypothetical protein
MAIAAGDKYQLRSLHEEIALFDRKLAHLANHEKFASDEERDAAARKMTTKRNTLVATARRLVSEGVEFNASELPKSLRPEGSEPATSEPAPEAPVAQKSVRAAGPLQTEASSPYAGTALDWQASMQRYLAKKKRA